MKDISAERAVVRPSAIVRVARRSACHDPAALGRL